MVNFDKLNNKDLAIIIKIVRRYKKIIKSIKPSAKIDSTSVIMDISATHLSNPLRLEEMLKAKDIHLLHDVTGIGVHLNRKTGKLEDLFTPRYSV